VIVLIAASKSFLRAAWMDASFLESMLLSAFAAIVIQVF
jgi:hypothetical protein